MSVRRIRVLAAVAALAVTVSVPIAAQASEERPPRPPNVLLLVHGYNENPPTDCNGLIWGEALQYFQDAGYDRANIRTIGYYEGDEAYCDDVVGDGRAGPDRPIQDIARDFANYIYDNYTSKGREVDIIGHSMGGLVTRVAVLGTGEGWAGFPPEVAVDDIVTAGTPHQGLVYGCQAECTYQWRQMTSGENGTGFIDKLHESAPGAADRGLDDPWAAGIDWSLIGSKEDSLVSYSSAIDHGYFAHQKYGYDEDLNGDGTADCSDPDVDHGELISLTGDGGYCLRYWHHGPHGGPHTTSDGWSPLKAARNAVRYQGDGLPR